MTLDTAPPVGREPLARRAALAGPWAVPSPGWRSARAPPGRAPGRCSPSAGCTRSRGRGRAGRRRRPRRGRPEPARSRARRLPAAGRRRGGRLRPPARHLRRRVRAARRPGAPPLRHPADRHFYGHGVFDPTGRLLFATENDVASGQGVLGVYDAADGYRRVGELPAHGVGPHDVALLPDGRTLAVANGGILTRPETGRAKLNLGTMRPSLSYVEAGAAACSRSAAGVDLRQLSIRHLAQVLAAWSPPGCSGRATRRGSRAPRRPRPRRGPRAAASTARGAGRHGGLRRQRRVRPRRRAGRRELPARGPRRVLARGRALPADGRGHRRLRGRAGRRARPLRRRDRLGAGAEVDARTGVATPWGERAPVAYDNHLTVL